jgi:hypothetical protein
MKPKQNDKQTKAVHTVNGKFYSVVKVDHLLFKAVEIVVQDGVVQEVNFLQKAEDLAVSSVACCQREIWHASRNQTLSTLQGTTDEK